MKRRFVLGVLLIASLAAAQKSKHSLDYKASDPIAIGYVITSRPPAEAQKGMKAVETIRKELKAHNIASWFDGSRVYNISVEYRHRDAAKKIVLKLIEKQKLPAKLYKD